MHAEADRMSSGTEPEPLERADVIATLGPNREVTVWRCIASATPGRVTFSVECSGAVIDGFKRKSTAMRAARRLLAGGAR